MQETQIVRIERLVYGGDAMGRLPDGRAVFVAFALPGELVRLKTVEEKPRYVRAELEEVLEPAQRRVAARCIHFGTCGGCHYQHMDYPAQLEAKSAILQEQLQRIGGFSTLPPVVTLPAAEPYNYRNQIQFHQTKEGRLGFQKAHSNQTFAIRECHLPEPAINRTWPLLDIEPIRGLERVILRVGMDDELMLILESASDEALEFSIEDLPISIVQTSPSGHVVLAGSDHLLMEVAGRRFIVSGGSFFQTNTFQAEAMLGRLMQDLPLSGSETVLDVYCGVGLFSAYVAPKVKNLVGIELSPQACEDFSTNLDEFENVSLYEAPAEDVLGSINFNPDIIIVDPPREGLGVKTVDGILAQGAQQLAYVSCDPATLARDAKRLYAGGYQLSRLTLVDMFPQTFHIESISYWEKK